MRDTKRKTWRRKGTAQDPNHTTACVRHGGGSVMVWAQLFMDNMTSDRRREINSEVLAELSADIQLNPSVQVDDDPKHAVKTFQRQIR